jgi:hypothetical protein
MLAFGTFDRVKPATSPAMAPKADIGSEQWWLGGWLWAVDGDALNVISSQHLLNAHL